MVSVIKAEVIFSSWLSNSICSVTKTIYIDFLSINRLAFSLKLIKSPSMNNSPKRGI